MRRPSAVLLLAAAGLAACGSPEAGAPAPSGTVFVLDRREDRLLTVDAASGRTRVIRPRGLAKCGARIHAVGGRLVYLGYTRRASYAYALDPRAGGEPRRLGTAHELIPSRTPGRVWLAKVPRCRNVWRVRALHEVTLGGRVTRSIRGDVPGIGLIAALDRGLLLHGRRGGLVVWRPGSTRRMWSRRRAFALAAGGDVVAWCPSHGCRSIRLTHLESGGTLRMPPPRRLSLSQVFEGALSSDGSLLAVPAATSRGARRLVLIETASGRASTVARSRVDRDFGAIAWAPGGWLFWSAGHGRLMARRPGSERAVTLPVRLPHPVLALAAGGARE
jgi:hypothetical protein